MTLEPVCKDVETAQGVPLTVNGVAQVKINGLIDENVIKAFLVITYFTSTYYISGVSDILIKLCKYFGRETFSY